MNFLGIGLPEIVLIEIIAIIVVGPQRLPEVAIQIARAIRYLRGYATDATAQIRAELAELTKEYDQVRKELQEFRRQFEYLVENEPPPLVVDPSAWAEKTVSIPRTGGPDGPPYVVTAARSSSWLRARPSWILRRPASAAPRQKILRAWD